jgi:hypothetical protein
MSHDHAVGELLAALVDEKRLDDLLAAATLDDVAEAWACFVERNANTSEDPDWWAVEFWLSSGLAFDREDVARAGLLALVAAVPDDLLAHVGAGPLENFIEPDTDRLDWIERQAAMSERFRHALANVQVWGFEQDWVCSRLEHAAGVPLARPRH